MIFLINLTAHTYSSILRFSFVFLSVCAVSHMEEGPAKIRTQSRIPTSIIIIGTNLGFDVGLTLILGIFSLLLILGPVGLALALTNLLVTLTHKSMSVCLKSNSVA
jgi:hypothetical protein